MNTLKATILIIGTLGFSESGYSQKYVTIDFRHTCSFECDNNDPLANTTYRGIQFPENSKVKSIVKSILAAEVLPEKTYQLLGVNMESIARIANPKGQRIIYYSEEKIKSIDINNKAKYWYLVAVFSHEIGHHLMNHNIESVNSDPEIELEADEFAGSVINKLGGSKKDVETAFNQLSDIQCGDHPAKQKRTQRAIEGWNKEEMNRRKSFTKPESTPIIPRSNSHPVTQPSLFTQTRPVTVDEGRAAFWTYCRNCNYKVEINGFYYTVTSYINYPGKPDLNSPYTLNVKLAPGRYNFNIYQNNGFVGNGSVSISSNGCSFVQLGDNSFSQPAPQNIYPRNPVYVPVNNSSHYYYGRQQYCRPYRPGRGYRSRR